MEHEATKEEYTVEVVYDKDTSLPRWMVIRLDGRFHSPPDDRPAHVVFDDQGRPNEMRWFCKGTPHRENGPAVVRINPENGIVIIEEYRNLGVAHRSFREPAHIERDPESGEVLRRDFYVNGASVSPNVIRKLEPKL